MKGGTRSIIKSIMQLLVDYNTSVHKGKKPFKCEICDVQFELKHELNEHIASVHEEENQSAHNDCVIMCHSCEKPATHFCKSCDQNLCKFCIIDHYRNTNFTKNHDMIPL